MLQGISSILLIDKILTEYSRNEDWNTFPSCLTCPKHRLNILNLFVCMDHTNSAFVSLGRTNPIKQSEGLGGMHSMAHISGEYGRMKRSLAHMDLAAGILITPAQSRCFKYATKSWNPLWSPWEEGSSQQTSLLWGGELENVDFTWRKSVRFVISNLIGHSAGSATSVE